MIREAWNPQLPAVTVQPFTVGGVTFSDGDSFPWQEMGLAEHEVFAMWQCGIINVVPAQPAAAVVEAAKQKRTRAPRATR